ncbi:MAG: hypothetical protein C0510_09485 [Erythrobacter sp.]|nr:hypothetical protein [Erythrobacter sp.]
MGANEQGYSSVRRRPRPGLIALIVLAHLAALYALSRALAPDFTAEVERSVVSAFTVTVTAPQGPPPSEPVSDEGAQGEAGERATPRPVAAPPPKLPKPQAVPLPRVSSTGSQSSSGAQSAGHGTGGAGSGGGTGSGASGSGSGGAAATKPVLIRAITDARLFPVPPGGREARVGQSVIVRLIVSPEGRVSDCRVHRPSAFPETDAAVCRLAPEHLRFEPARDRDGRPVAAPFYYRQRFFD